jgi:hypothetical protein
MDRYPRISAQSSAPEPDPNAEYSVPFLDGCSNPDEIKHWIDQKIMAGEQGIISPASCMVWFGKYPAFSGSAHMTEHPVPYSDDLWSSLISSLRDSIC